MHDYDTEISPIFLPSCAESAKFIPVSAENPPISSGRVPIGRIIANILQHIITYYFHISPSHYTTHKRIYLTTLKMDPAYHYLKTKSTAASSARSHLGHHRWYISTYLRRPRLPGLQKKYLWRQPWHKWLHFLCTIEFLVGR